MGVNGYDEREPKWREKGIYYGYPQCCIESFIQALGRFDENQQRVHDNTGFVPCPEHAKQIVEGKATLGGLINNRQCPTPFPIAEQ